MVDLTCAIAIIENFKTHDLDEEKLDELTNITSDFLVQEIFDMNDVLPVLLETIFVLETYCHMNSLYLLENIDREEEPLLDKFYTHLITLYNLVLAQKELLNDNQLLWVSIIRKAMAGSEFKSINHRRLQTYMIRHYNFINSKSARFFDHASTKDPLLNEYHAGLIQTLSSLLPFIDYLTEQNNFLDTHIAASLLRYIIERSSRQTSLFIKLKYKKKYDLYCELLHSQLLYTEPPESARNIISAYEEQLKILKTTHEKFKRIFSRVHLEVATVADEHAIKIHKLSACSRVAHKLYECLEESRDEKVEVTQLMNDLDEVTPLSQSSDDFFNFSFTDELSINKNHVDFILNILCKRLSGTAVALQSRVFNLHVNNVLTSQSSAHIAPFILFRNILKIFPKPTMAAEGMELEKYKEVADYFIQFIKLVTSACLHAYHSDKFADEIHPSIIASIEILQEICNELTGDALGFIDDLYQDSIQKKAYQSDSILGKRKRDDFEKPGEPESTRGGNPPIVNCS